MVAAYRDSEDEDDWRDIADEDRHALSGVPNIRPEERWLFHHWNLFRRRHRVRADSHIPWAAESFARVYARHFQASMSLRRMVMLKLCMHGLLSGAGMSRALAIADGG